MNYDEINKIMKEKGINVLPKEKIVTFKEKEICNCVCHQKGRSIMHCTPCCELTYHKYLNEEGVLNEEYYSELTEYDSTENSINKKGK